VALGSTDSAGTRALCPVNEGDSPGGEGSTLEWHGEAGATPVICAAQAAAAMLWLGFTWRCSELRPVARLQTGQRATFGPGASGAKDFIPDRWR
jgi:hypothetical protein